MQPIADELTVRLNEVCRNRRRSLHLYAIFTFLLSGRGGSLILRVNILSSTELKTFFTSTPGPAITVLRSVKKWTTELPSLRSARTRIFYRLLGTRRSWCDRTSSF